MAQFHMPRGYGMFISGTSLIVLSALALFFVLVSWAVGGTGFMQSIFGDVDIAVLTTGIIGGAILVHFAQKRGHRQ